MKLDKHENKELIKGKSSVFIKDAASLEASALSSGIKTNSFAITSSHAYISPVKETRRRDTQIELARGLHRPNSPPLETKSHVFA
ncbi:hypothetical protein C4D60_Mb10t15050 [Musa balbisiana]|uniref:Uncharacterized protein n=1 Tax=Musa balbisiana TaxID=52838 RepID=A0A4S8IX70_MUSBA|nr:hypothetical protein C4D60_Mb10t15050 [Musa balbisiana]